MAWNALNLPRPVRDTFFTHNTHSNTHTRLVYTHAHNKVQHTLTLEYSNSSTARYQVGPEAVASQCAQTLCQLPSKSSLLLQTGVSFQRAIRHCNLAPTLVGASTDY